MQNNSSCPECDSINLQNKGNFSLRDGTVKRRYKCRDCGTGFSVVPEQVVEVEYEASAQVKSGGGIFVISSVSNASEINLDFVSVLQTYCKINGAKLILLPVKHKVFGEEYDGKFPEEVEDYIQYSDLEFPEYNVKILSEIRLSSTIENPLAGLDPISKGHSVIVGHPQVQLKTLPRIYEDYPAILTTTGSISEKNYSNTKPGIKAKFNHSFSAVVLEMGKKSEVHIRHLNYSSSDYSLYDLGTGYSSSGIFNRGAAEALVTGDEHAVFADPEVKRVTYTGENSLVSRIKPKYIVRHDVLDAYSVSHHHEKSFFTKYSKYVNGTNSVEDELNTTVNYIKDTTPSYSTSILIQSNHNEHLYRWLNEADPKLQPWNAKLYHKLMYKMLDGLDNGKSLDPFEIYAKDYFGDNIKFIDRDSDFSLFDIQMSSHGDAGTNGARGSRKQFSILPTKTIIGHSHSPGIEKGCYQVGTSSIMRLEYNKGASSWHHTHCIVHPNGKRQLVFIVNGKYKL